MPSLNRLILATQSLKFSHSVIDLIHHDIFTLKFYDENSFDQINKEISKNIYKLNSKMFHLNMMEVKNLFFKHKFTNIKKRFYWYLWRKW